MISLRLMLIAIGVFNFADYVVTLQALEAGFMEDNPFMDAIIHTPWSATTKLILIPCSLAAIWLVEDRLRPFAKHIVRVGLVAYAALMVYHGSVVIPYLL